MNETDDRIAIYPTGTCFEDVTEYLNWKFESCRTIEEAFALPLLMVHAIVQPNPEKGPFSHAWIEEDGKVIGFGIINGEKTGVVYEKLEFYNIFRPIEMTRYTVEEGYWAEKKAGTFPPWEEKYRRLCRDFKEVKQ